MSDPLVEAIAEAFYLAPDNWDKFGPDLLWDDLVAQAKEPYWGGARAAAKVVRDLLRTRPEVFGLEMWDEGRRNDHLPLLLSYVAL